MPEILLVEDNPGDVLLMEEALLYGPFANHVHVARDGVEALSYLARHGEWEAAPHPDLIVLDINMPRMDGRAVLAWLKEDGALSQIPVVVFSSSCDERDRDECRRLGASQYYTKPENLDTFSEMVEQIQRDFLGKLAAPIE